ncbi:MAG TPA: hypothetical protein VIU38_08415 [Anaerolineales bacterium]
MSDPITAPQGSASAPPDGGSLHPNGAPQAASSGTPDGILQVLLEYARAMGKERRHAREMDRVNQAESLRAKLARVDAAKTSIDQTKEDANEKWNSAMQAVGLLIAVGIVGAGIALAAQGGSPAARMDPGFQDVGNALVPPLDAPRPTTTPRPSLYASCALNLAALPPADSFPGGGLVEFRWADVPGALRYELEVAPLADSAQTWLVSTAGTSKNIYMENLPAGGSYQASLAGISANGEVLCRDTFEFVKAAANVPPRKSGEDGGPDAPVCISNCLPPP